MVREWGSAHSLFHKDLFHDLIWYCAGQIEFEKIIDWGEDNICFSKIYSRHLRPGYHGQQDIILKDKKVRFKADVDV